MRSFAGIDWAKDEHAVCIVDEQGMRLHDGVCRHDEEGIGRLLELLAANEVSRLAIERPDGVLVDRLLAAGVEVCPVHPNQLHAIRSRYVNSNSKSDQLDAFCLAEMARTDSHRLRRLSGTDDRTAALRALLRAREELVSQRVRLANQLRSNLEAAWPAAAGLFCAVDRKISLSFLRRFPSPRDVEHLGEAELQSFLTEHRYAGRRDAGELLSQIRRAPQVEHPALLAEAHRGIVLSLVAAIEPLLVQVDRLNAEIRKLQQEHPDAEIFGPLFCNPRTSITVAGLIAGFGDDRSRYPDAESLAAIAGMAPITRASGKRRVATFRIGCDRRLRRAVAVLADTTRRRDPWAKDVYERARRRGHSHPHAIRILGRAWLRVLWRCWQDRVPYDPTKHGGHGRLLAAGG